MNTVPIMSVRRLQIFLENVSVKRALPLKLAVKMIIFLQVYTGEIVMSK